ncbi:MAG TPA: hypothetical protein VMW27_24820 [Thermoanaerobaculia bacterium]|nr:hypothetical protein [Thermoanaerobaculia bacterium]
MKRVPALLLLLMALLPLAASAGELCGGCPEGLASDCCSPVCSLCLCSLSAKSLVPAGPGFLERPSSTAALLPADEAPSTPHPHDILHVPKTLTA